MFGPALGSAVAHFGPGAPGFAAAALCLVNLAFVARHLPESASAESRHRARTAPRGSLRARMLEVLAHPRRPVARLVLIYTAGMMAFMAMNAVLALFLQARFGFTERTIGYAYTAIGVVSLVMRSVILGPTVRRCGERGVMRLGLGALACGFALQPFAPTLGHYAAAVVLVPVGTALLFPATSSLVSRFADRHALGATMGVQQAYGGVARLLGPVWAGAAFQYLGAGAPFLVSALLALAALVFVLGLEPPPAAPLSATVIARAAAPAAE
jgi:predicted MFS family arabinose efflux permease